MTAKKIYRNFKSFDEQIFKLKKKNKKIVLCHGVFDLFHAGHLYSFKEAKKQGDVLIVSVTSDNFVKKAPNRPFFKFEQRAEVLSGLSVVDFVIESSFISAVEIIKFLKPNVYFKGPDYKNNLSDITGNIIKEKKAVEMYGGKIVYGDSRTFSSSKILNSFENFSKIQRKTINYVKKNYGYGYINKNIFQKIAKDRVLIIGEIIIDKYVFTKYLGVSGKEAIRTLEEINQKKYVGGSLAIANNLSTFVDKCIVVSTLGREESEIKFCKNKINKNVYLDYLKINEKPTITKTKILDISNNQKILGLYKFNDKKLTERNELKLLSIIKKNINQSDTIIVSDYGHNIIGEKVSKMISKIKKKNLTVNTQINAANFGYHTISKYKGVDCAVINEIELRFEMRDRYKDISRLTVDLSKNLKIENLFVTCGQKGSYAYSNKQNKLFHCPAFATDIVDKIGAGDCFMSILSIILKYCRGDLTLAMFIASIATIDVLSSYGNEKKVDIGSLNKRLIYMFK